jgi:hypothetical protein
LVVLPVRYTKIPFFLEGKERERENSSSSILWVPRMDVKFQIGG